MKGCRSDNNFTEMYAPKNVVLVIEITKLFYSLQEISVRLGFFFFYIYLFLFEQKLGNVLFQETISLRFIEQNKTNPNLWFF